MEMYARAVALDPGFALAFAKLSQAHTDFFASTSAGRPEDLDTARTAAETALRLRPDLAQAHVAMGYYHFRGRKAYDAALREFTQADRLQPNNGDVIQALGLLERRRVRMREAVQYLKRAAELDPRSAELASDIGMTDWFLRAYPESEQYFDRAISLSPTGWRRTPRRPGSTPPGAAMSAGPGRSWETRPARWGSATSSGS
jgi:tetratricopeptide (TPR) repeat protein